MLRKLDNDGSWMNRIHTEREVTTWFRPRTASGLLPPISRPLRPHRRGTLVTPTGVVVGAADGGWRPPGQGPQPSQRVVLTVPLSMSIHTGLAWFPSWTSIRRFRASSKTSSSTRSAMSPTE